MNVRAIISRGQEDCLHEKNCWNQLSAPKVHLKKIVCKDCPWYARFELLKKLYAQSVEEKKLQMLNRWWKKISCLLEMMNK